MIGSNSAGSRLGSKKVPLLDVNRGNRAIREEVLEKLTQLYDAGTFINGQDCRDLEKIVADVCQTEHAVACASGSDAIVLALMAIDLQPGDEVICPSFTFFATASAVWRLGGIPVFADIDPHTFNISPKAIESVLSDKTKAIIPVHLFGQCADMPSIMEIARKHRLHVLEDVAQAIGACYDGKPAGSFGTSGSISFYPTKNIGGCGDGGMLVATDKAMADRLRLLANHGMSPRYYHKEVGINSRLDSMQAAILKIKMRQAAGYAFSRRKNAETYRRQFMQRGMDRMLVSPTADSRCYHVWNQFTVRIPDGKRDQIRNRLTEWGVGTEVYYPVPLHQQECFQSLGYRKGDFPETERAAAEVLSLPIYPELTSEELNYVVDCLEAALMEVAVPRRMAS